MSGPSSTRNPSSTSQADIIIDQIHSESLLNLLTSLASETNPLGLTQMPALDAYCIQHGRNSSLASPLKRGDVIEIQGPPASGKTHLTYHLLATCVMPSMHSSTDLHGWDMAAIVYDTDYAFDVRRFKQIIRHRLQKLLIAEDDIPGLLQKCISRLALVRVSSSLEMAISILNAPTHTARLFPELELGMLVVDSISSFYWPDRFSAERPGDHTVPNYQHQRSNNRFRDVVAALHKIGTSLSPVIVLTNWGLLPTSKQPGGSVYYRQHLVPFPDPFAPVREGVNQVVPSNLSSLSISYHITTEVDISQQRCIGHLRCPTTEATGRVVFSISELGVDFE